MFLNMFVSPPLLFTRGATGAGEAVAAAAVTATVFAATVAAK